MGAEAASGAATEEGASSEEEGAGTAAAACAGVLGSSTALPVWAGRVTLTASPARWAQRARY
eukprot:scaffold63309_cov63-Phaeocystis_antarctica.AAC.3